MSRNVIQHARCCVIPFQCLENRGNFQDDLNDLNPMPDQIDSFATLENMSGEVNDEKTSYGKKKEEKDDRKTKSVQSYTF